MKNYKIIGLKLSIDVIFDAHPFVAASGYVRQSIYIFAPYSPRGFRAEYWCLMFASTLLHLSWLSLDSRIQASAMAWAGDGLGWGGKEFLRTVHDGDSGLICAAMETYDSDMSTQERFQVNWRTTGRETFISEFNLDAA